MAPWLTAARWASLPNMRSSGQGRWWLAALGVSGLLLLGACSGRDDAPSEPTPTSAPGAPTVAEGAFGPAPPLGGNVLALRPAHGERISQPATRPASQTTPGGLCVEVSFTGTPEYGQWFRIAFDETEVTEEMTWFVPPIVELSMPEIFEGQSEATFDGWFVRLGDPVSRGDIIAQATSPPTTRRIEATEGGTVLDLLVVAGQMVTVGDLIARLGPDSGTVCFMPPEGLPVGRHTAAIAVQNPRAQAAARQVVGWQFEVLP